MSWEYDQYLHEHKENVKKAFDWISSNLPYIQDDAKAYQFALEHVDCHDLSKTDPNEYDAYDAYFYGNNRSYKVTNDMNLAFLHHIHKNGHHWQYWILTEDKSGNEEIIFEMPFWYAVEMICDWWSFSWKSGNLYEIFDWWDEHKDHIRLHKNTRKFVEKVLGDIKRTLDKEDIDG